jgi:hypothetical protein
MKHCTLTDKTSTKRYRECYLASDATILSYNSTCFLLMYQSMQKGVAAGVRHGHHFFTQQHWRLASEWIRPRYRTPGKEGAENRRTPQCKTSFLSSELRFRLL